MAEQFNQQIVKMVFEMHKQINDMHGVIYRNGLMKRVQDNTKDIADLKAKSDQGYGVRQFIKNALASMIPLIVLVLGLWASGVIKIG